MNRERGAGRTGRAAVAQLTGLEYMLPCLALAVLIGVWIFVAFGDRLHLATIAMAALAGLAVVLTWRLLGVKATGEVAEVGFWPAFKISVAMPLSWLPLISDYTSAAERPRASTVVSAAVYTLVSLWMYALGVLIARIGATSIADGIVKSGIGMVGLVVVIFSTVTTTFLDAYSAGESAKSLFTRARVRLIGVAVCALGGTLAVCGVMDHYIGFLYLISSVFAPMATVLLVDRYLIRRGCVLWNLLAWLDGVLTYQFAGNFPIGPSLTAIAASALVAGLQILRKSGKV